MLSRKFLLTFCQRKEPLLGGNFISRVGKSYASQPLHTLAVENLKHRNLFKVFGPDSTKFLQGILTNDIYSFDQDKNDVSCIYAMVLNVQGRVLCDTLVYKLSEEEYFLEYESVVFTSLKKHLDMFRLRKQVDVKPMDDKSIWVAFPSQEQSDVKETLLDSESIKIHVKSRESQAIVINDPRINLLGCRVILQKDSCLKDLFKDSDFDLQENNSYQLLRFKLGVGEGTKDHPLEDCFPLECNVDYLNGVNFQKGCYIGQELTARIHHTGIVRKRLMPVRLKEVKDFPAECKIINEKGLRMGRLRNNIGTYGLAALNSEESLRAKSLTLKGFDVPVNVTRPKWWPKDDGKVQRLIL